MWFFQAPYQTSSSHRVRRPACLWSAKTRQALIKSAHNLCEDFGVQTSIRQFSKLLITIQIVASDCIAFACGLLRSRTALVAENLFLRKQLGLFQERKEKARQTTAADRFIFAKLAPLFDWRGALVIVKPATLISWHRAAFRRFWRWKSRPSGRPKLPAEIRILIRKMAAENPSWGEERIADELRLKLGIRVSPRTVGKYLKQQPRPRGSRDQRWSTFVRNHADAIVACDFFVSITARFRILYVFVAMEIGSRRILHFNVTEHPTAEWTLQQLRETLPGDHSYRFLIHDRQGSFSAELDDQIQHLGVRVLRSPVGAPTANAHCERLIGSMRRECLDFVIPMDEWQLRRTLRHWSTQQFRPSSSRARTWHPGCA
jgi:putative transposase